MAALAREGLHLHFDGDFTHGQWLQWIDGARRLAPAHLHLHEQVDQDGWVIAFFRAVIADATHVPRARRGHAPRAAKTEGLQT